jgi:hypothetical protein
MIKTTMGIEEEYRQSTRGLALLFGASLLVLLLVVVWLASRSSGASDSVVEAGPRTSTAP